MPYRSGTFVLGFLATLIVPATQARAQVSTGETASPILVELFTSEGCSSCPPADELLRHINGQKSPQGQLIIGLSEHVTYWNQLGWKDPFSAEQFTARQNEYSSRFHTEGPYTPQMVVNGRSQFVGSDRAGLLAALKQESARSKVHLHLTDAKATGMDVKYSYLVEGVAPGKSLRLMAVLVDDGDQSSVPRGENAGRTLEHVFVARTLVDLGNVSGDEQKSGSLSLTPELAKSQQAHHLVLFLQQSGLGFVEAVDAKAF